MDECRYSRALQELKSCSYGNVAEMKEMVEEDQYLQLEMKDLKYYYIMKEKKRLYLENLSKDKSQWCTVEDADKKLKCSQIARKQVKEKLNNEKERLKSILEKVKTEQLSLEQKILKLEEKLKIFESKKQMFEAKWKKNPATTVSSIEKCKVAINRLETEIITQKTFLQKLKHESNNIRSELDGFGNSMDSTTGKELITRMKKVIEFLETMSGIKVSAVGPEQLGVHFITKSSHETFMDTSTLDLEMTLTFKDCKQEEARLADVKVSFSSTQYINIEHFNIKDIIETSLKLNDVPYLIMNVSERWNRHFPLLTEMDQLTKHHAVDWMPDKGQLRVLVGKCGNIMFSLGVPKDYPASRDITLLDSFGINDLVVNDLPEKGSTLCQWVLFLEDKYGHL
ncbi:hypothetical protein ACF0H5_016096 [Mactra antiquata]